MLLSTTYYYYNDGGNVTRVVENLAGTEDYAATGLVYTINGSAVAHVITETWQWSSAVGGCPTKGTYDIICALTHGNDAVTAHILTTGPGERPNPGMH